MSSVVIELARFRVSVFERTYRLTRSLVRSFGLLFRCCFAVSARWHFRFGSAPNGLSSSRAPAALSLAFARSFTYSLVLQREAAAAAE